MAAALCVSSWKRAPRFTAVGAGQWRAMLPEASRCVPYCPFLMQPLIFCAALRCVGGD